MTRRPWTFRQAVRRQVLALSRPARSAAGRCPDVGRASIPIGQRTVASQVGPMGRFSAGLPVGVRLMGRPWREDAVLAAMSAIEHAPRKVADFPRVPKLQAFKTMTRT